MGRRTFAAPFRASDRNTRYHECMRTANPALGPSTFRWSSAEATYGQTMTVQGTVTRALILLLCVLATAAWTWSQFFTTRDPAVVGPYLLGGAIGGFVMALV